MRYHVAVTITGTILVDADSADEAAAITAGAIPALGNAPVFDRYVKAWVLPMETGHHRLHVHDANLGARLT